MPHGCVRRSDFPSADILMILLDELAHDVPTNCVLEHTSTPAYPDLLSPCVELELSSCSPTSFVMSQKRGNGEKYITVHSRRASEVTAGVKKQRSHQPWPRTRETNRLRPVYLHRWIAVVQHGLPPSPLHEAAHICGNQSCITASHIRWQLPLENIRDRDFHKTCPPPSPDTTCGPKRRYARTEWPSEAAESAGQASLLM